MVKVADFGLTEDIYSTNSLHYQNNDESSEERLPIRWMALESIENNIFNEKTDVVSLICSRKASIHNTFMYSGHME